MKRNIEIFFFKGHPQQKALKCIQVLVKIFEYRAKTTEGGGARVKGLSRIVEIFTQGGRLSVGRMLLCIFTYNQSDTPYYHYVYVSRFSIEKKLFHYIMFLLYTLFIQFFV